MTCRCTGYDSKSAAVRINALCEQIVEQQNLPSVVLIHVRGIQQVAHELMIAGSGPRYETKGCCNG